SDGEIYSCDIATGRSRLIWDLSAEKGPISLFQPSSDGKKLLIFEQYVPVGAGTHSFALLLNADGTGPLRRIDLGRKAGQIWLLKRPDDSIMFNPDATAPEFRKDDDNQWVLEPARGNAIRFLSQRLLHAGVSPSGRRIASQRNGLW